MADLGKVVDGNFIEITTFDDALNDSLTGKPAGSASGLDSFLIVDATTNQVKKITVDDIISLSAAGNMNSYYNSGITGQTGFTTISGPTTATLVGYVDVYPQSSASNVLVIARMNAIKDSGTTRRTVTMQVFTNAGTTQVGKNSVIVSQNVASTEFGPAVVSAIFTHNTTPGPGQFFKFEIFATCDTNNAATISSWEICAIELIGPKGDTGPGLEDGGKGDISVTSNGQIWTIEGGAVTLNKIQLVSANTFLANANGTTDTLQEISTNRIPLFPVGITGTPSSGTFLRGDGSWQSVPSGATNLDGLSDVVIATPTTNQILLYNGTNWVNNTQPPATASHQQKSISIISPVNTDRVGIWYITQANTYYFLGARYFLRGSSPSISLNILSSTTRTGTTSTLASLTSGTSTSGATFGSSSGLLGNVYIWVEITSVGGTVDELWLQLEFSTISPV